MVKKIAGMVAVALFLMLCMAPVIAEESDASVTERIVNDLYVAETTVGSKQYNHFNGMAFIAGSENYDLMQAYIADPYHAEVPEKDDSDSISSADVGKKLYIYSAYSTTYYSVNSNNWTEYVYLDCTLVFEGSPISFFVKEGEKFTLEIIDANLYGGNYLYVAYGMNSESISVGDYFEMEFGTNTVVRITPDGVMAADVTYEASGYSLPNGSSIVFVIAAIVVAAVVLAILIMCGLHPKWES